MKPSPLPSTTTSPSRTGPGCRSSRGPCHAWPRSRATSAPTARDDRRAGGLDLAGVLDHGFASLDGARTGHDDRVVTADRDAPRAASDVDDAGVAGVEAGEHVGLVLLDDALDAGKLERGSVQRSADGDDLACQFDDERFSDRVA